VISVPKTRTIPGAILLAALLPAVIAGCAGGSSNSSNPSGGGSASASTSSADSDQVASKPVQNYLDAMKTKDVAKAKDQLCPALQAGFESNATKASGDFANTFTVTNATVTTVQPGSIDRTVTAAVTAKPKATNKPVPLSVEFTVHKADGGWCISKEALAPTPTPSA
jgi:hypothetical protein